LVTNYALRRRVRFADELTIDSSLGQWFDSDYRSKEKGAYAPYRKVALPEGEDGHAGNRCD
jgi:hypothetical protein